nr:uncharacterized protein LOC102090993 [Columba livia]
MSPGDPSALCGGADSQRVPLCPGCPCFPSNGPQESPHVRGRCGAGSGHCGGPPRAAAEGGDGGGGSLAQVFRVEVLCNGRRHTVAKRYSEFQALHKRIKKTCKVPDFPPRRVPNWMPKVLEQRRQGLELYLRGVLYHNEELPQDVLDFLKVRRCQQDPKASGPPSAGRLPSQRPVIGFCTDPYARPLSPELLPDTVLSGVLQGLYLPWGSAFFYVRLPPEPPAHPEHPVLGAPGRGKDPCRAFCPRFGVVFGAFGTQTVLENAPGVWDLCNKSLGLDDQKMADLSFCKANIAAATKGDALG